MSMIEIANRIKEEVGLDSSLSVVQVVQAACEQVLTPRQVAEVSRMTTTKQKLQSIAAFMELN